MKTSQVIKAVCDQVSMEPHQVLFKGNGRRSSFEVSKARHLLKFILYYDRKMSTPRINRLFHRISTGFDHASTLHSLRIINDQRILFWRDVEGIRERLTGIIEKECLKKNMN